MNLKQEITVGIAMGLTLFFVLLAIVFVTGATFGQRCTAMGYSGLEHSQCVATLAAGEDLK
jgi:hypothetical protein